jgi:hypothetical protein
VLEREQAVLGLESAMWGEEAREAAAAGGAAGDRLAAGRADAADADAELARVQADGPANHRKRDPIDKARAPSGGRRTQCGLPGSNLRHVQFPFMVTHKKHIQTQTNT